MALGLGGTLSPQQSWDVAAFIDSQVRPQDPRFNGGVEQTRKKYHDSEYSMYGRTVNGAVLGDPDLTPPAGTVPPEAPEHAEARPSQRQKFEADHESMRLRPAT